MYSSEDVDEGGDGEIEKCTTPVMLSLALFRLES